MRPVFHFTCTLAGLLVAGAAFADVAREKPLPVGTAARDRFLSLFQPLSTEIAALSPDGKLMAHSLRDGQTSSLQF